MPPSTSAAPSSAARALRRHLLHLVLSVVALDAAFLAVYRFGGVADWSGARQRGFTVVWVVLTLLVVSVFLSRVRATRIRARRARAAGRAP